MQNYETLDPQDWEKMRALGHKVVDDMVDFLSDLRNRPVWQPMPEENKMDFKSPVPHTQSTPEAVYHNFTDKVMPYIMGNPHPRFWAWYMGSSSFMGALADFLTSITNSNAGAGNHAGQLIEDQVIQWMIELMGYSEDASGIIVSGGSMANFVALAVARHVQCGFDIRNQGMTGSGKKMTVYASTEIHSCNQKAMELLGLGADQLRKVEVNSDYTINITALNTQIEKDKSEGYHPICIIGSAGTVNTGAIDDLQALHKICQRENLWFHVDGAIGAIAMMSEEVKPLLSGIEKSDSVAIDLHKWMHVPFEAGCVLVKNRGQHRDTFHLTPEYLEQNVRGLASGTHWYSEYGIQLSRRLKALKVWMTIQEHGVDKLGRMMTRNVAQAKYLGNLISQNQKLELMAAIGLDIVCYRYNTGEVQDLNTLNREILIQLHERGIAVPSYTTLNGQYCIRVAIANHRSKFEDFDLLVEKTLEIGNEITVNSQ